MGVCKKIALMALGSMFSGAVLAEQVNVDVMATVTNVYDPAGVMFDVQPGASIGGQYRYETNTADIDSMPGVGFYPHAMATGGFDLTLAGARFTTDVQTSNPLDIFIMDEAWTPGEEGYHVSSWSPHVSGDITVDGIMLDLYGQNGNALSTDALTTTVPNVQAFNMHKELMISGSRNGQYFSITAKVDQLTNAGENPPATSATQYMYKVTAQIDYVDDIGGYFGGAVTQGGLVTAYYKIDTTTPGYSPYMPNEMVYPHAPGAGQISMDLGAFSIEATTLEAYVWDGANTEYDYTGVRSDQLTSSSPVVSVDFFDIHFGGNDGTKLNSTAMVTDAGSLSGFEYKFIHSSGNNGGWWFGAQIISVELVPQELVEVVPAAGRIHPAQRFDAAIYLTEKAPATSVVGSINNMDISYQLQYCQIFPVIDASQAVICPDINYMLQPGNNDVHFEFQLMDQTVEVLDVIWTLK